MERNEELRLAWEFVEHTGVSIFLTGKAGTGKTTFLKAFRQHSAKTMIVVAPTGVAAINAGGVTIHSFFQLPPSPYVPGATVKEKFSFAKEKLRIIKMLDLLVIDEISMVRSDLLDAIDNALRKYRRDPRPFGGVQLLMIGDLQQLAPVVTPADEVMLRDHYSTPYFFGSKALQQIPYVTIRLNKVYRQQNGRFVELLNHLRDSSLTDDDRRLLASRLDPTFRPAADSGFIRLTSHNHMADSYNSSELERLDSPRHVYSAEVKGTFPDYAYPTSQRMTLKVGSQVMFVKNDTSPEKRYYNGKIGTIISASPTKVKVKCPGDKEPIEVEPSIWENAKYTVNEKTNQIETEVQGTFKQMPLRLAWAITIHKSQGLTFDNAIIDAGAAFAPGQVYVALSRCRSLEGMVLATPLDGAMLQGDPLVTDYISRQDAEAVRSVDMLPAIKRDYHRHLLIELFTFREISDSHNALFNQIYQVFRHMFRDLTGEHAVLRDRFREKVIEVADRWIALLSTMPDNELNGEALLKRVGNSAVYFKKEIDGAFGDILTRSAHIKSDNKKASQRLQELLTETRIAVESRLQLLDEIARNGFTIANYLAAKQEALADASRPESKQKKSKAKATKEKAPKPPKEPKESSAATTYRMFKQGMTRHEIAIERNMAVSTITVHLTRYVATGELSVSEVVTPVTANAIASAIKKVGFSGGMTAIKNALPSDISYDDIRLVAAHCKADGSLM